MIPDGGRGLLINHEQYEFVFKDRMAGLFDITAYELFVKEDDPIAINYEIQGRIKRRQLEVPEWVLDLGALEAHAIRNSLMAYLKKEGSLEDLFIEFIEPYVRFIWVWCVMQPINPSIFISNVSI